MQENILKIRRGYFLLKFTECLIKNSKSANLYLLQEMLKFKNMLPKEEILIKPDKTIKQEVQEKLEREKVKIKRIESSDELLMKRPINSQIQNRPQIRNRDFLPKRRLPIPKQNSLPPQFADLKPSAPTSGIPEIDLGKLNPFLKDRNVRVLEVTGKNEKVFVMGNMGKKPTAISLDEEEIDYIINKFSQLSRIPKTDGLYKVAYGNLVLNAIVSEDGMTQSFIIKKI